MKQVFNEQVKLTTELIATLPWEDKEFYANYLMQTYHFVSHSTRLLARCISLFSVSDNEKYDRFVAHISEENHHERLAFQDAKALGVEATQLPALSVTKAFYESQYYKIDCSRGVSLLGYILYLEAIAVESFPPVMDRLTKLYGTKSTRFLKVHTEEDPHHVTEAFAQIDALSETDKALVYDNFIQTAELYRNILVKCSAKLLQKNVAA